MTKSISTFCNASRSHLAVKTKAPYVWVSEDILSETFSAFVRNHKRFGSNVPGPLEARKRASKRRATHLAHQSATTYTPESFGLYDTQAQQGWWQKAETSVEPKATSWPWPFSLPHVARGPPPPPVPSVREDTLETFEAKHRALDTRDVEVKLQSRLDKVCTHTAAMDVLSELSINLRHTPQLANVVLRHMLARSWEYDEVAEYLLDPRSNISGTTNHIYVLEHAEEHSGLVTWLFHRKVFAKAARLGLLDIIEIQQMLQLVPRIDVSVMPKGLTWASFCSQLIEAMDASHVLSVHDLDKSFVLDWLEGVHSRSFCTAVPELLWRLYQLVGSNKDKVLEEVAYTSISMAKENSICDLCGLVDFMSSRAHEHVVPVMFSLTHRFLDEAGSDTTASASTYMLEQQVDWLFRKELLQRVRGLHDFVSVNMGRDVEDELPTSDAERKENQTSEALSHQNHPNSQELLQQRLTNVSKLELWYAILGNLGSASKDQLKLDGNTFKHFLESPEGRDDARQRVLAALWVVMSLSVRNDAVFKTSGIPDAIAIELQRTFSTTAQQGSEDILANICQALQASPLPAKNKLFRRLHALSGKAIDVKENYWMLSQRLDDLNDARVLDLGNDAAYRSMKQHFPAKLIEIAEGFNTDMLKFERTCINIIHHAKGSISIVLRLLDNNQELQNALRKAGIMMRSGRGSWDHTRQASQPALGGHSYLELVDMMENFAHEAATSEQLSCRNALRKVYWIKDYLGRCKAPLRPSLRRALWRAGVTRYDEAGDGACYHNVRWLYNMISEQDGEAEANRLLYISGMMGVPGVRDGSKGTLKKLYKEYEREFMDDSEGTEDLEDIVETKRVKSRKSTLSNEAEATRQHTAPVAKTPRRPRRVVARKESWVNLVLPTESDGNIPVTRSVSNGSADAFK